MSDQELIKAWDMDGADMMWWFRFLYDRRDDFYLLLSCSQGTRYANFPHDWVGTSDEATSAYLAEAQRRGLCRNDVEPAELHILLSAFWTTIYEPFIHHFTWEQIEAHCRIVCGLFNWHGALHFQKLGKASPAERFFTGYELAITNYQKRRFSCVSKSLGVCGRVPKDHLSLHGGDADRHCDERAPLPVHLPTDPPPAAGGIGWNSDTRRGGWRPSPSAGSYTLSYM